MSKYKNGDKIFPRLDKTRFFHVSEDPNTRSKIFYSKEHQIFILSFLTEEFAFDTITQLRKERPKLAALQPNIRLKNTDIKHINFV